MQLTPRYDGDPIIRLDGDPSAVLEPLVRQQTRFVEALGRLDADQWAHPSRCDGWSARDVIVHLESATGFWVISLAQGLGGAPSRFLSAFDPVATPAQMVEASDVDGPAALERFAVSSARLAEALGELDAAGWCTTVEAPPGHVSASTMAHHALWDSWIHERDVFGPLGVDTSVEPDEVVACLRYAAALGPAFALSVGLRGARPGGSIVVEATDPEVAFTVSVGDSVSVTDGVGGDHADARFVGDGVRLTEAFSRREPLGQTVPEAASWMLDGLAEVFDQA